MISENKENDRKSHKLDDDGGVRSIGIKPVRFREHLVIDLVVVIGLIIVEVKVPSSFHGTNTHPSPFNESVLNNADVIILSELYDKD
ncbi:8733_t:CDS:2 [Rhizophagus irregularis]|nr:8733_t:CDS:2 [Rhizophagus irregularis]